MIGTEFRYTPEYKSSDLSQRVSAPFQQLSASMRQQQEAQRKAQAAADAAARKERLAERNRQYSKLYGVATKGFDGWSEQTIREYERQVDQSMKKVLSAPDQDSANQITTQEALRLLRLHGQGDKHAKLYTGQNSAHDQYVQWDAGAIPWKVDGMEPITSGEDLVERENRWENATINLRTEDVNGYQTSVGDYVAPNGMLIKDEAEQMFQSQGIPYDIQTDPGTGMVSIVPQAEGMEPIVIGGPLMQHPNLGSRQWFMPESQSIAMPFAEFAANTGLRKNVQDIEANYNSDESPITREEAMATARGAAMTIFMNDPRAQAGAAQLYQETYGVPFNENDFVPNPATGQSRAQAEGRAKRPEELYLDKVMPILGSFEKRENKSTTSPTRRAQMTEWQNTSKQPISGLPSDIRYEDIPAKFAVFKEDAELLRSLEGEDGVDVAIPEGKTMKFENELVNHVVMYPDANVVLVRKVNADPGTPRSDFFSIDDPQLYESLAAGDTYQWKKVPEKPYFVLKIKEKDAQGNRVYTQEFRTLESNLKDEYKASLEPTGTPLKDIYLDR